MQNPNTLRAGVFAKFIKGGSPADKVAGACVGMKLLRVQLCNGKERIVEGHTLESVEPLINSADRPLTLTFEHPWRELPVPDSTSDVYYWNTFDNATASAMPPVLDAVVNPKPEPAPEPKAKQAKGDKPKVDKPKVDKPLKSALSGSGDADATSTKSSMAVKGKRKQVMFAIGVKTELLAQIEQADYKEAYDAFEGVPVELKGDK